MADMVIVLVFGWFWFRRVVLLVFGERKYLRSVVYFLGRGHGVCCFAAGSATSLPPRGAAESSSARRGVHACGARL